MLIPVFISPLFWLMTIPLLGALGIALVPQGRVNEIRSLAVGSTLLTLLIALYLVLRFDPALGQYQFRSRVAWLLPAGISYHIGVDGIGVVMILLHAILSFAGTLVSRSIEKEVKLYFIFYLVLVASIFGVFSSLDIFFLYLFYEMSVVPLYPMIGIWGSQNKEYASMKLILYITLGAVLALVGLLGLYFASGLNTFDLVQFGEYLKGGHSFPAGAQIWISALLIFGFGVIASLWPFHSWSPIGYAAAPSAVSMLHAGVLKKMGIFLIIRLVIPLLPEGAKLWLPIVAVLCVVNILYGAWAAMIQNDMKFAIGFASVSHMGYAFLGLACFNEAGITATVFFMFAHGIMAALCFALIGFIYDQAHTRLISDFGGLARQIPFIAVCFAMAGFASSGLPGFANFISEILIFFAAWEKYPAATILAIFGMVLTATYMLRMIRNVFFGPLNPRWVKLNDAKTLSERLPYGLLMMVLLITGFFPSLLLNIIRPAVDGMFQKPAAAIQSEGLDLKTGAIQ